MTMLDLPATDSLAGDILGDLVTPGRADYGTQRKIWNGEIDRRPAVIARCQGAGDVAAVIRWSRERGLPLAVRGGGHGIAGHALVDDGVVLDLSAVRGVVVDPVARTVSAQGGALNVHIDRETQVFGLGMTSGYISHTGIAGLTLGGGIGHLMRFAGLSIDALRSCQVVTADGSVVQASAQENPDLFWGLRGGGGNFGVVTDFTFELRPVGPTILAGLIVWPADQAPAVLAFLRVAPRAGRPGRPAPGLGAGVLRRAGATQPGGLRQLHQRRRAITGARGLQPEPVDAAALAQDGVGPGQRLPGQRQHPSGGVRLTIGRAAAIPVKIASRHVRRRAGPTMTAPARRQLGAWQKM